MYIWKRESIFSLNLSIFGFLAIKRFSFKARLLGENSPHNFIPDPGNITFSEAPEEAARLIAMHTTFITTTDYKNDVTPQIGDVYVVALRGAEDEGVYNLQLGDALYRSSAGPNSSSSREGSSGTFKNRPASDLSGLSPEELQIIQAEGTSRSLDDLHPDFRPEIDALIRMLSDAGFPASISGTYRSDESQVAAYELGRSEIKEGGSHSTTLDGEPASMAIDIISAEGNGWADKQSSFDFFEKLGEFAVSLGLTWGGDWSPETKTIDGKQYTIGWDPAHVESPLYHGYTNT